MRLTFPPRILAVALGLLMGWSPGRATAQSVPAIPLRVIAGGGGTSSGGALALTGTVGQPVAVSTPDNPGGFSLSAGFWPGVVFAVSGVEGGVPGDPHINRLLAPYPNPFNPAATIAFELTVTSPVQVRIYDTRGQLVRDLVGTEYPPGHHEVVWDGRNSSGGFAPSGVYFVRFEAAGEAATRKITLLK